MYYLPGGPIAPVAPFKPCLKYSTHRMNRL